MQSRRLHGVQVEQVDHYRSSGISLGDMLHISVHTTSCFRVWGCDKRNPQQTAAATYCTSRISHFAQQQQLAAGVATNGCCANRYNNILPLSTPKITERGDASRRGLSLHDLKRSLICLVRRMVFLQFALFCVFLTEQASLLRVASPRFSHMPC